MAFHQQAADEVGGDHRGGAGEERLGGVLGGSWWLREWLGGKQAAQTSKATISYQKYILFPMGLPSLL